MDSAVTLLIHTLLYKAFQSFASIACEHAREILLREVQRGGLAEAESKKLWQPEIIWFFALCLKKKMLTLRCRT